MAKNEAKYMLDIKLSIGIDEEPNQTQLQEFYQSLSESIAQGLQQEGFTVADDVIGDVKVIHRPGDREDFYAEIKTDGAKVCVSEGSDGEEMLLQIFPQGSKLATLAYLNDDRAKQLAAAIGSFLACKKGK